MVSLLIAVSDALKLTETTTKVWLFCDGLRTALRKENKLEYSDGKYGQVSLMCVAFEAGRLQGQREAKGE